MAKNLSLKHTFTEVAELYDQARPVYPPDLFISLINQTGIKPSSKLLEIGPGTGQATKPLAEYGSSIVAIELGPELAAVAKRNLSKFPNVNIQTGSFEEASVPEQSFDLVYSATAFHWIKPEFKFLKPYKLLKPNSYLAIIRTVHIGNEDYDPFHKAVHPLYEEFGLADKFQSGGPKPLQPLPRIEAVKPEPLDEKLFESVYFHCFPMNVTYTAQEYIDLIGTYSPHLAMKDSDRHRFHQAVHDIIHNQFGSRLDKPYGMSLTIGRKLT
jgi:trans-aconitate methyltransferase